MAVVIDFHARASLHADKAEKRKLERAAWADLCRDEIVRDFRKWPRTFRDRLDIAKRLQGDPYDAHRGLGCVVTSRNRERGRSLEWFAGQVRFHRRLIASAAGELREARHRPRAARIRASRLEQEKKRLLWLLFEFGFQKVPRRELAELASLQLSEERAALPARIAHAEKEARQNLDALTRGIYEAGRSKGNPFKPHYVTRLTEGAASWQAEARRLRDRLAYLDRQQEPLRAWGLYADRRRSGEAEGG